MIDIKVSKDKNIGRWVDRENLNYVRKLKKVIDRGKRSKTLSEEKPVENINKNLQSFLEIIPMQKEVPLSHELQEHAYKY